MLLALIIAIIFGTTSGSASEFVSLIPNIKREIRQNVSDDARKAELFDLLKAYEKTIKKSQKEEEKLKKEADKASANYEISKAEFLRVYDNYYNSRERLLASLINYRLLFQEQITEEEIQMMYKDAMIASKKERRKEAKQEIKAEEKLLQVFDDIEDIVVKHISDSTNTSLVRSYLGDFESTIFEFIDEAKDLGLKRRMLVDDVNASREEIIKHTTKKEWKAINRELKVFLKS